MKKHHPTFLVLIFLMLVSGCLEKKIDPSTLQSSDEKACYDLVVALCRARNTRDLSLFKQIYTKDSPDLDWIEKEGIPLWRKNSMYYRVSGLRKISIVKNDAAANFVLHGDMDTGYSWLRDVEVLFVKQGNQWKIESVGARK
jgi:hypothetical protein